MKNFFDNSLCSIALEALETDGYFVWDHFLESRHGQAMLDFLKDKQQQNELQAAGIGSLAQHNLNQEIRGDYIYWLTESELQSKPFQDYHHKIALIAQAFRHYFRIAVQGSEFHLACYPKGSFYKKHLDQFKDRNNRLLSLILYLNPIWEESFGGQLRLHLDSTTEDISPLCGRLVLLRSDLILHEVLTTEKERYSLTGWLCRNKEDLGFLI